MTSYFDHFLIVPSYLSNSFFIFFSIIFIFIFIKKNIISKFSIILEVIIDHWKTVIHDNLKIKFFIFPISSLFFFLLGLNLLGFFIYSFPPSTHISLTFAISIISWLGIILYGFKNFNSFFLSMLMPLGAPLAFSPFLVFIEIVSNITRPIALGLRLAANLTAGHILLSILSDFGCKIIFFSYLSLFPIFIIIFMTILEIGVLIIQAYVFCLLLIIYLKDSMELH
uniref:ATP synthase F0 subunit 6 n=1 Tax=Bargmannia lata TaxID=2078594 RepID=UPI0026E3E44B|nr:ATP synthase F0 subunit 6 [Bargmannia lata]WJJ70060.1 ATP synthase F0 subunit 6 [Bargmannia lata]